MAESISSIKKKEEPTKVEASKPKTGADKLTVTNTTKRNLNMASGIIKPGEKGEVTYAEFLAHGACFKE